MVHDLILQIGIILLTLLMFLAMHNIPQKLLSKLRLRNRAHLQSKRHFVKGAQLLSQARSAPSRSAASSLASLAAAEADAATLLDPSDAAAHILKALALDLQGFKTSALDSLDNALAPIAVASLGEAELADALCKRAQIKIRLGRRGAAAEDLARAVEKGPGNARARLLLGECYEANRMREDARREYEEALRIQPGFVQARRALDKLIAADAQESEGMVM